MLRTCSTEALEADSIHIYRLEHGKLAEHWAKRDDVRMAAQLGLFAH